MWVFFAFENVIIHNKILVTFFASEKFDLTARCKTEIGWNVFFTLCVGKNENNLPKSLGLSLN